jgi:hypothetical protein
MSKFEQIIDQILSKNMDNSGGKLTAEQQHQLLFMMLIQQHEQIAMMGLGRLQDSDGNASSMDLNAARYAIDTLRMLDQYTKGNLSEELKTYLHYKLNMLQEAYNQENSEEE